MPGNPLRSELIPQKTKICFAERGAAKQAGLFPGLGNASHGTEATKVPSGATSLAGQWPSWVRAAAQG